jgi:hypothetical protein
MEVLKSSKSSMERGGQEVGAIAYRERLGLAFKPSLYFFSLFERRCPMIQRRVVKIVCAVQRRASSAGSNPARQLSFHPELHGVFPNNGFPFTNFPIEGRNTPAIQNCQRQWSTT